MQLQKEQSDDLWISKLFGEYPDFKAVFKHFLANARFQTRENEKSEKDKVTGVFKVVLPRGNNAS